MMRLRARTVSKILKTLQEDDLVLKKKKGKQSIYSINLEKRKDHDWVNRWASHLTTDDLMERMKKVAELTFLFNKEDLLVSSLRAKAIVYLDLYRREVAQNETVTLAKIAQDARVKVSYVDVIKHIKNPYCPDCLLNRKRLSSSKLILQKGSREDANFNDDLRGHEVYVCTRAHPIKESNVQVFPMQHNLERWLDTAYQTHGKSESFDDYVNLVHNELRRYIDEGAVSVKIWSAFFRSLYFQLVEESVAKGIYFDYINGRRVDEARYKQLQDYLAHLIFSFCMEHDVPVQVHTGFGDSTKVLTIQGSSPLNLENIAKGYDDLKLVLIHGGYPFCKEAWALAMINDNVYLDYSYIGRLVSVPILGHILGDWIGCKLEDRLLFGTDSVKKPWATDDLHCVYVAWKTRKAVEDSLLSLIDKGVLDVDEAIMVASKILRSNAAKLYEISNS